jgi:uncharacterized membrane protein
MVMAMAMTRHITRCMLAGVVALLPLGGAVLGIVWIENALSSSWRKSIPVYFPGLGLLLAALAVYGVGLFITTFVGRLLWAKVDHLLESIPLIGSLYDSLKEVLGYDSRRERFFRGVVALPHDNGVELGLITGESTGVDGQPKVVVFLPSSPNPTNGRLLLVDPQQLRKLDLKVADVLRVMVSMGKSGLGAG